MHRDQISLIIAIVLVLALAACSRQQEKYVTAPSPEIVTKVLSTITHNEGLQGSPRGDEERRSLVTEIIFSESGRGVAYTVARGDRTYVVHNDKRSKEYDFVGPVVLSTDGQRIAYGAHGNEKWRLVIDGIEGKILCTAIAAPLFSSDARHVAYQAMIDGKWHLVVDDKANEGAGATYYTHQFNADSTLIAYSEDEGNNKTARLVISDLKFSKRHVKESLGTVVASNRDQTRLAVKQVVGNKMRLVDFSFVEPENVREGPLYDAVEHVTFGDDGVSVSYVAEKDGSRLLVFDHKEERLPQGEVRELPVIRPGSQEVGVLLASHAGFFFHQAFTGSSKKGKIYEEAAYLTYSRDGSSHAYVARNGKRTFVVVNGKEGPAFDTAVKPVFSPAGDRLVYRARKGGKRFLVVADIAGKTLRQHPAYEQVFQPTFTDDGKSVVYGVKDGNKLISRVEAIYP